MTIINNINTKPVSSRSIILRTIHETGGAAAAEISRITGMGPVAVKHHVDQLLNDGKIVKSKPVKNGQGRPPIILKPNTKNGYLVGIDMDPAAITAIVVDKSGAVVTTNEYQIESDWSSEKFTEALIHAGKSIIEKANVPKSKIEGIGFALTGFYDRKGGILVMHSALSKWHNVPIKYMLEENFDIPVFVEDSIKANTLAEQWYGDGVGVTDFVTMRIRTMVSLGIVVNGHLYLGNGNAGTVNELFVLPKHAPCVQGQPRTLQELGSGRAVLKQIQQKANSHSSPVLWDILSGDITNLTLGLVVQAAEQDDPLCTSVLCETSRFWGRAIARISELIQPQKVIISGVFAELQNILARPLDETLQEEIFPALKGQILVEFSKLGRLASAKGAAAMVLAHGIYSG